MDNKENIFSDLFKFIFSIYKRVRKIMRSELLEVGNAEITLTRRLNSRCINSIALVERQIIRRSPLKLRYVKVDR